MASVHYFQRYSQQENVVTNNTLLLLSRLYHYSPSTFGSLLQQILEDIEITVGPTFAQQQGGRSATGIASIPDGEIVQASFQVLIETKLSNSADRAQLIRHLDRFKRGETKVLLLVAPEHPPPGTCSRYGGRGASSAEGVRRNGLLPEPHVC